MSEEAARRMGKSSERLSTPFSRTPRFFLGTLLPSAFSWASRAGVPSPLACLPHAPRSFYALTSSKRLPTPTLKQHYQ